MIICWCYVKNCIIFMRMTDKFLRLPASLQRSLSLPSCPLPSEVARTAPDYRVASPVRCGYAARCVVAAGI